MKKVLALICALALLAALAVPAMGEGTQLTLEDITLRVKQALDISDDFADFTSDSYDGTWNLTWSGGYTSIYVTCSAEGEILSYSRYEGDGGYSYSNDYVPRFPTAGTDSVRETASEFLGRVIGEGKSWTLDEVTESLANDNTTSAYVSGRLVIGEYPTDITLSVTVDLKEMKVTNYYRSDSYMKFVNADFDTAVNITEEEAKELLKDKSALTLKYYVMTDGGVAKLCYIRNYNGNFIVRAADGEVVNIDDIYAGGEGDGAMSEMAGGYGDGATVEVKQLTEAELKGISVYKDALPADELDQKARAFTEFGLTDDYLLTSVNYYNGESGLVGSLTYSRKITDEELSSRYGLSQEAIAAVDKGMGYYDTKNVTLVAATGELESFYTGHPYIYGTYDSNVDLENNQSISDAFIQKYFPDIFSSIELSTKNDYASPYYYSPTANYYYVRLHNGYTFDGNYVSVNVNADDGTIDSFYKYWNEEQEFEEKDAGELVTADAAYETFAGALPFELALVSVPQSDGTYGYSYTYTRTLAWRFADNYDVYGIDATTGELLRYGYNATAGMYGYSDIEGVEQQEAIEALARFGVGFSGGEFKPDSAFTVRDMLILLLQAGGYTGVEDMEFTALCTNAAQIGAPDFSASEPDAPVTKLQFAGLIVDMHGFGDVAGFTGIYSSGFADDASITEADYGHVAIAYGMGLIAPDADNNINATAELTRAEGAQIIYNFLNRSF